MTTWCEEKAAWEGNLLGLSRSEFGGHFRVSRRRSLTGSPAPVASAAGSVLAAHSLPVGSLRQDATVIGRTEDRSWWKTSGELVGPARVRPACVCAKSLERRLAVLPEDGGTKRRRDVPGKPGARLAGIALERQKSP